jgi:glutamyl-tRNA synthetase
MPEVVTRYAPSPTGALHIGGARTALFCWAFARHHGGRFLLRFEDTDRERSTRANEQLVLEALDWLGIDFDPVPGFDGIPRQSEREPRYGELIRQLLESGHAYRCIATEAELEEMRERARREGRKRVYDGRYRDAGIRADCGRPSAVRLKVPESGAITRWDDLIAGPSGEAPEEVDDFVIARADGSAIYHFAVVVDDHDMGVTHVLRGREHMTSTPRQLLLYQALGWQPPLFAHVPLLVEPDGRKLSKRHGDVSVQAYRDRGFPPEAMLNYLARLGWSHGDLEIVGKAELARLFELSDIGRSPSQVHEDKLLWLSQHYLKTLPLERLAAYAQPFLEREAGGPVRLDERLRRGLDLLRERSQTLADMAAQARFLYVEQLELDEAAARKFLVPDVAAPLADLRAALADVPAWEQAELERAFHAVVERHGLKLGKLAQPVRLAVTGRTASPGIFETLAALGRDWTLARLDAALARIRAAD